jgi:hypothetical protein
LVTAYHILKEEVVYADLGRDYFDQMNKEKTKNQLTSLPQCHRISIVMLYAVVFLSCSTTAMAQGKSTNSQAQTAYETGLLAEQKGDTDAAATEFRKAFDLDHNFIDAHLGFIETMLAAASPEKLATKKAALVEVYRVWWAWDRFPGWALALGVANEDDHDVEAYPRNACALHPELAKHLSRASSAALASNRPELALRFAYCFRLSDRARYEQIVQNILTRFPTEPIAMEAIGQMAADAGRTADKIVFLERIRTEFARFAHHEEQDLKPANKYMACPRMHYNDFMERLFEVYLKTDGAKALEVAEHMALANPNDDGEWLPKFNLQKLIVKDSIQAGKSANDILTQLDIVEADLHSKYLVLRRRAYDNLLNRVAEYPVEPFKSELLKVGERLWPKRSPEQVDQDLWQLRMAKATPFYNFELPTYDGKRTVKLADLRGTVVVMDFWGPD